MESIIDHETLPDCKVWHVHAWGAPWFLGMHTWPVLHHFHCTPGEGNEKKVLFKNTCLTNTIFSNSNKISLSTQALCLVPMICKLLHWLGNFLIWKQLAAVKWDIYGIDSCFAPLLPDGFIVICLCGHFMLGFGESCSVCAWTSRHARLSFGVHAWTFGSARLSHGEKQPVHARDLIEICCTLQSGLWNSLVLPIASLFGKANWSSWYKI